MSIIGNEINGVTVKFAPTVNRDIDSSMMEGLRRTIRTDIAEGHVLNEIFVSATSDEPESPGRLTQGKALDISRVNGMKLSVFYSSNKSVKAIVDALQSAFERYPQKRENFGPLVKKKQGMVVQSADYRDHVHLSVN